jgi:hypothetical protein
LETYADLFDTDLDALAEVLDAKRSAALAAVDIESELAG